MADTPTTLREAFWQAQCRAAERERDAAVLRARRLRSALERLQQIDPQQIAERFTSIMALCTVVRQIVDNALADAPLEDAPR